MPDIDPICEICGNDSLECECLECPVCGVQGDPKCYEDHVEDVDARCWPKGRVRNPKGTY